MLGTRIRDYQIEEEIDSDEHGVVYRALQTSVPREVAIKIVRPSVPRPEKYIARYIAEARIIARLEHPHIVPMYEYWRDEDAVYLVMRWLNGGSLRDHIQGAPASLESTMQMLEQAGDALGFAHESRIVHRDLKPENILLDENGFYYLSDFGIAKDLTEEIYTSTSEGEILGTPRYISPEQVLGDPITPQSDIYSLGILLFEMLAGESPFPDGNVAQLLMRKIDSSIPPLSAVRADLPKDLDQILRIATAREPGERYDSVYDLIADFSDLVVGKSLRFTPAKLSNQSIQIRLGVSVRVPSFVTVSRPANHTQDQAFVGREQQLEQLDQVLAEVLTGSGQIVFVSGEAGWGKSSLLRAFTERALNISDSLVVARGNCNQFIGLGDPFLPFREILAMLSGDVEAQWTSGEISREQALRLWGLLPSLGDALTRFGPYLVGTLISWEDLAATAAGYESTANGELLTGLGDLLLRKKSQEVSAEINLNQIYYQFAQVIRQLFSDRPLLMMIEDLHWADQATLGLLAYLAEQLAHTQVMVLCTFRPELIQSESALPASRLADLILSMKRAQSPNFIDSERMDPEDDLEFVHAFLEQEGKGIGREFRSELARHTGGNALFLRELLSSFERRGELFLNSRGEWQIASDLNWDIQPEKLEHVIGDRIDRLDEGLRDILAVAGVIGEEFSAQLVAKVLRRDLRQVLKEINTELVRNHLLVRYRGERTVEGAEFSMFAFTHISYQLYVYKNQSPVERRHLHRMVAEELEDTYRENPEEGAVALVYHYEIIGNKTSLAKYLQLAGERALKRYAYGEAVDYFNRAKAVINEITAGNRQRAAEYRLQRAQLNGWLGVCYNGLGDLNLASSNLSQAIALLDRPVPTTKFGLLAGLARQALAQLLSLAGLTWVRRRKKPDPGGTDLVSAVRLYAQLSTVYYLISDSLATVYCVLRNLNLAERLGPSFELADAYARMSVGVGLVPVHALARHYVRRANSVALELDDPATTATVDLITGAYLGGLGDWEIVQPKLRKALATFSNLGDMRQWSEGCSFLCLNYLLEGKYERSEEYFNLLIESARSRNNLLHLTWGMEWKALLAYLKGDFSRSLELVDEALGIVEKIFDIGTNIDLMGVRTLALVRLGRLEEAQKAAEDAADKMAGLALGSYSLFLSYIGVIEPYFALWELAVADRLPPRELPPIKRLATARLKNLAKFKAIFPIGESLYYFYRGRYHQLLGKPDRAISDWEQGALQGERLKLPYHRALSLLELGRSLPQADPEAGAHLDHALEIFTDLRAKADIERARSAIRARAA